MSVLEVDGRPVALSNLDKVIWRDAGPVGRGGARPSSGRADCLRFGPGDIRRRIHRYGDLFEALRRHGVGGAFGRRFATLPVRHGPFV